MAATRWACAICLSTAPPSTPARALYAARLREDGQDDDVAPARHARAVNPAYVLRNHLAEQAIQAAQRAIINRLSGCAPLC